MRAEMNFNNGWGFVKLGYGTEQDDMRAVSDEEWQSVTLPHDWLIYDTANLYEDSTGWYRKYIMLEKEEGRRYLIHFDGVYMDSTVYVNGLEAGTNHYGYSAFEYDITELLHTGENEIVVQVRHKSPNSRWYSGAGIFRDVVFKNVPETHLATNGIYISPKKVNGRWVVIVDNEVVGPRSSQAELSLNLRLCRTNPGCAGTISKPCPETEGFVIEDSSHGDNCAACGHPCASRGTVRVSDIEQNGTSFTFIIDNPYVWDIETPNLYELRVALMLDGEEIDACCEKFGLREIKFTTDRGFFLNGRRVKLHGVCEHHDLGCLGAAFNKDAMRRKLLILKEMGVNAIRTSHNMPAKGFMELADEMGIMLDSEAFDMWRRPKTEYDYARFFETDCRKDIASWVREGRNHPSIIMWSVGNEIYDCHGDASAVRLTADLKKYVEENDYLHNAFVTHASNYMAWQGAQNCTDELKLAGYNYGEKLYDAQHEAHPDWMIYGSETSSTVQSRGVYHFPMKVSVMADDDEQCSALGNCTTSWGASSIEYVITADRDREFSAGQFIWSGFDYIGEPTPYHTKNSYFGQIDTAGFAKDTYYILKAEWTNVKKAPFVHVFPYWDFNEGQTIDIRVATNAPVAELIVNGVSQGKRSIDHEHGDELCPIWSVPYHKGYIEAVAYDENGRELARERHNSFGDAKHLCYRKFDFKGTLDDPETVASSEAGRLAFYEIYAEDEDGNIVENANLRVDVSVTGGTLLGLDNGDSTDYDQYKCSSRRLFNGKLLAVVRIDEYEDDVELELTPSKKEVPIRKIELTPVGGQRFTDKCREIEVEAEILPEDATYDDLTWLAVNDYAVKSNLAMVEADCNGGNDGADSAQTKGAAVKLGEERKSRRKVRVTALGDGDFRIRCMTGNGKKTASCISTLEFTAEGIGTAYINPYEFVAGSLYTDSKGDVGNGNEKGVATPRDGESYIGYENIDFGDFGSDEVTLPIFTLDGNEYAIGIWEGRPGDAGSELLCDGRYQKPSIWNVYQPETYKLKRRVKGVTSIYFTANAKYHIKGFTFKTPDKAFAKVYATENSRVYGDSFNVTQDAVTGIRNNVTLEFDDMVFSSEKGTANAGARKVVICGRTPLENTSVHLKFTDMETDETVTELIEFSHADEYEERSFDITPVIGNRKVAFVFLPGSNFDMKWFRFE